MEGIHLGEGTGEPGFSRLGILPNEKSLQFPEHWFEWNEVRDKGTDGWILPGQGVAYSTCGTYHVKGCLVHNPGYFKKIKDNCARAECPEDYRTWMIKATKAIVKRVEKGEPRQYRKPIHVTISPPRKDWIKFEDKENYLKQRRKTIRLAKKAGIMGGCLIFHPYRENKPKKRWYWSPHFHILGYGWIIGSGRIFKSSGWIVKNLRVRKNVGATAYYQLSHAGVKGGHHVVSWFGSLSWRALRVPREKAEPETCPMCGSRLRRVIYYGTGDNPMSDPNIVELYMEPYEWTYLGQSR